MQAERDNERESVEITCCPPLPPPTPPPAMGPSQVAPLPTHSTCQHTLLMHHHSSWHTLPLMVSLPPAHTLHWVARGVVHCDNISLCTPFGPLLLLLRVRTIHASICILVLPNVFTQTNWLSLLPLPLLGITGGVSCTAPRDDAPSNTPRF
jgi:hypothetical protein